MRSDLLVAVLAISIWLCGLGGRAGARAEGDEKTRAREVPQKSGDVRKGISAKEVQASLGLPRKIARQILYRRHLEQWTYDAPISVRVELDCVRGQEPHVISVHSLRSQKP